MKCEDCQELFSLYFDGEIDPAGRFEVDSHFAVCPQCRMEWLAFRNTTRFLRDMPMASVPPDFLTGIHEKLESRSPWRKITEFFSGRNEKKWALSTAFATLLIGVVTASLTQVVPVSRTATDGAFPEINQSAQVTADRPDTRKTAAPTRRNTWDKNGQADFYPGVPLLSEYEAGNTQPAGQFALPPGGRTDDEQFPMVDFVSTGAKHASSPYLDTPFRSFVSRQQIPAAEPDLQITIHSSARTDEQMDTIRRIVQSRLWRTEPYGHNALLLSVPAGNFDHLLHICGNGTTSFSPEYADNRHYISLKRFVTVAVSID